MRIGPIPDSRYFIASWRARVPHEPERVGSRSSIAATPMHTNSATVPQQSETGSRRLTSLVATSLSHQKVPVTANPQLPTPFPAILLKA